MVKTETKASKALARWIEAFEDWLETRKAGWDTRRDPAGFLHANHPSGRKVTVVPLEDSCGQDGFEFNIYHTPSGYDVGELVDRFSIRNVHYKAPELIMGALEKAFTIPEFEECDACEGVGEAMALCGHCEGNGRRYVDYGPVCRQCRGSGEVMAECFECDGEGEVIAT